MDADNIVSVCKICLEAVTQKRKCHLASEGELTVYGDTVRPALVPPIKFELEAMSLGRFMAVSSSKPSYMSVWTKVLETAFINIHRAILIFLKVA